METVSVGRSGGYTFRPIIEQNRVFAASADGTLSILEETSGKVLSRFDNGQPSVFLLWMPAGPLLPDLPYRHYHKSVREFSYILQGELPHWEYRSSDQSEGELMHGDHRRVLLLTFQPVLSVLHTPVPVQLDRLAV